MESSKQKKRQEQPQEPASPPPLLPGRGNQHLGYLFTQSRKNSSDCVWFICAPPLSVASSVRGESAFLKIPGSSLQKARPVPTGVFRALSKHLARYLWIHKTSLILWKSHNATFPKECSACRHKTLVFSPVFSTPLGWKKVFSFDFTLLINTYHFPNELNSSKLNEC